MFLAFVDETGDVKRRDYLGLSIAVINSLHYLALKPRAQKILTDAGWDPNIEFKGAHLFSASKGCLNVPIEARVDVAHRLLELNVAAKNVRIRFCYVALASTDVGDDYHKYLPGLLKRTLPRAPKGAGKNLLAVTCDERDDLSLDQLHERISAVATDRGYVLLERVHVTRSSFHTVGLMFADLVGYLVGRMETITADADLFDGLTSEQLESNGILRKLKTSQVLVQKIQR